jgi:hypothetical protein
MHIIQMIMVLIGQHQIYQLIVFTHLYQFRQLVNTNAQYGYIMLFIILITTVLIGHNQVFHKETIIQLLYQMMEYIEQHVLILGIYIIHPILMQIGILLMLRMETGVLYQCHQQVNIKQYVLLLE